MNGQEANCLVQGPQHSIACSGTNTTLAGLERVGVGGGTERCPSYRPTNRTIRHKYVSLSYV